MNIISKLLHVGGLADKSEDHIERAHQDGKRSEIIYCGLTNFKQSQVSQLKIMT